MNISTSSFFVKIIMICLNGSIDILGKTKVKYVQGGALEILTFVYADIICREK